MATKKSTKNSSEKPELNQIFSNLKTDFADRDEQIPFVDMASRAFVNRAFQHAIEPGKIMADVAITSVTIDIHAFSVRPISVLEAPINIDMVTHRLANHEVRAEVAKVISNADAVSSILASLMPGNFRVNLGTPLFTRFTVYDTVSKSGVGVDAALVVTDLLVYALQNLGIVGMNNDRNHFQVEVKKDLIPNLDTVVHELIRTDVERHLDILKLAVAPEGKRIEYSNIIIDRITDKLRLIGAQLRRVGEIEGQVRDVLSVLRIRINPSAYAESKVDRDLLDHPSIVDLATDATMIALAASIGRHTRVHSDIALLMKVDQIVARMRDVSRFKRISRDEFKNKFTKHTVYTDKGRPLAVVIGQNFKGGVSVQVLDSVVYDTDATRHQILAQPMIESFLATVQGEVMTHLATSRSVNLLTSELSRVVSDESGYYVPSGVYSIMIPSDMTLHILAMCTVDRVSLALTDSGNFTLLYKADLNGVDYVPVSSAAVMDEARLADPAEALLLLDDWDGDFYEGDRVQVLPKEVINNYVYGDPSSLELIDLDKELFLKVQAGTETFEAKAQFLDLLGRGYLDSNFLVKPFINAEVAVARFAAIEYLVNVAKAFKGHDDKVYAAIMTRLCREVSGLHTSFNDAALKQVEARIVDSFIANAAISPAKAHSRLRKDIYASQIRHLAIIVIAQRIGLVPLRGNLADVLNDIQASAFFSTEEGIAR